MGDGEFEMIPPRNSNGAIGERGEAGPLADDWETADVVTFIDNAVGNKFENVGFDQDIVGLDDDDVTTLGHFKGAVQRIGDAAVRPGCPLQLVVGLMRPENANGAVAGPPVAHDMLKITEALAFDRFNAVADRSSGIE
jgi:hypothetical protein